MAEFRAPKPQFSLATRRDHVNRMANLMTTHNRREVSGRRLREEEAVLMERHSADVIGTFNWLIDNEQDIARWLEAPAEARAIVLNYLDVAVVAARKAMESVGK
ncbi:hypothetical protein [Pleomorphomonas carboxyditropha]|uniref:Uncharacterized protein n=1 Tax=Pleomorphomonas carboxyditropha TaxID=2023338 RepID=A0A2G9WVB0_9HYPH|nr:hypothetical protein [Pleomorphomonas carboxyditropha]PIO98604.1 hypothetical protein CJ014_14905 [Pleomorphomonas carboxyditropha]